MTLDSLHEHDFIDTVVDGLVVDSQCVCGIRPMDLLDATMVAEPEPEPVDRPRITGGEGHGSANARQLLVIQKLPDRSSMTFQERTQLLDSDIREAMVTVAKRLNAEAMKYSNVGFVWDLDDIVYDMGAPRTLVGTLRIARGES